MLAGVIGTTCSSIAMTKTGYPLPWLIGGPLVSALASGLLFWELKTHLSPSLVTLGILQFLFGYGAGTAMQLCLIVPQAEYKHTPKSIPQASAMMMWLQLIGGTIGVSIAGTIFTNKLESGVKQFAPGLSANLTRAVAQSVDSIHLVPKDLIDGVIRAYSDALGWAFVLGIPAGLLGSLGALLVRNHNLKKGS